MRNLGLTARKKLLLQILAGLIIGVMLLSLHARGLYSTEMNVPFFKTFRPDMLMDSFLQNPLTYPLAFVFFFLFLQAVLLGSTNGVNLADGLDGLAIGLMIIASGAMTILTYMSGHAEFAKYLDLARLPGASELTIFCGAMTGASLAFLWYNAHPAEVFMGDVGSLSLGGGLGTMAILIKQEILLLFVGGVFVIECLSVISAGGQLQAERETHFQDGPAAPSFRGDWLARVESNRAVLDCGPGDGAVRADDIEVEVAMEFAGLKVLVVGLGKSGLSAIKLLVEKGAHPHGTDSRPLDQLPGAGPFFAELGIPFHEQSAGGVSGVSADCFVAGGAAGFAGTGGGAGGWGSGDGGSGTGLRVSGGQEYRDHGSEWEDYDDGADRTFADGKRRCVPGGRQHRIAADGDDRGVARGPVECAGVVQLPVGNDCRVSGGDRGVFERDSGSSGPASHI
jgi:hypothetical protein